MSLLNPIAGYLVANLVLASLALVLELAVRRRAMSRGGGVVALSIAALPFVLLFPIGSKIEPSHQLVDLASAHLNGNTALAVVSGGHEVSGSTTSPEASCSVDLYETEARVCPF